jgi:hypothetical protein
VIHQELTRVFERTPQPSLSPEFAMNLRRRLRGAGPPHRHRALPVWSVRLYWLVAAVLLARFWRPVPLTPSQMIVLAMICAAVILTLRRAARSAPLSRVLRQLWHSR